MRIDAAFPSTQGDLMMLSMLRINRVFVQCLVASCVLLCHADFSNATIVGAKALGSDLAGGSITVNFAQQGPITEPIVVGPAAQEGSASNGGNFQFSVIGDTFLANWRLDNLTTFDTIRSVIFDLRNSQSLFDDGTTPDTMNGFAGRAGAVQVNAGNPFIIASGEIFPWADAMNAGDEYQGEEIFYEGFGPLTTSVWRDDTDIIGIDTGPEVPEPSSVVLIFTCMLGITQLRYCQI